MYGNVKTHKIGNPTRVINPSIFIENVVYDTASELTSRIKGTDLTLDIIDNFNSLNLPLNSNLVSFDIINMFPNIDNNWELSSVKKHSDFLWLKHSSINCLLEAIELCLTCNNSVFNNACKERCL